MTQQFLAIRLSALGDVAMVVSQLRRAAIAMPEASFTLITRPFMAKLLLYEPLPNLNAYSIDIEKEGTPTGLVTLAKKLHEKHPQATIIDFHDVLRSKVLRGCFALLGHKIFALKKPRKERKRLFHERSEAVVPEELYVPSMISLYEKLLMKATGLQSLPKEHYQTKIKKDHYTVGFAPHAQHKGKTLPDAITEELVRIMDTDPRIDVILYGAPGKETEKNRELAAGKKMVHVTQAKGLVEELKEIERLDLMVSMDSANMHLASLVGTRVVSIWGATHAAAGFLGYNQDIFDAVGIPLNCRPCSAYGQLPCKRGDYACLNHRPEAIYLKILDTLGLPLNPKNSLI